MKIEFHQVTDSRYILRLRCVRIVEVVTVSPPILESNHEAENLPIDDSNICRISSLTVWSSTTHYSRTPSGTLDDSLRLGSSVRCTLIMAGQSIYIYMVASLD